MSLTVHSNKIISPNSSSSLNTPDLAQVEQQIVKEIKKEKNGINEKKTIQFLDKWLQEVNFVSLPLQEESMRDSVSNSLANIYEALREKGTHLSLTQFLEKYQDHAKSKFRFKFGKQSTYIRDTIQRVMIKSQNENKSNIVTNATKTSPLEKLLVNMTKSEALVTLTDQIKKKEQVIKLLGLSLDNATDRGEKLVDEKTDLVSKNNNLTEEEKNRIDNINKELKDLSLNYEMNYMNLKNEEATLARLLEKQTSILNNFTHDEIDREYNKVDSLLFEAEQAQKNLTRRMENLTKLANANNLGAKQNLTLATGELRRIENKINMLKRQEEVLSRRLEKVENREKQIENTLDSLNTKENVNVSTTKNVDTNKKPKTKKNWTIQMEILKIRLHWHEVGVQNLTYMCNNLQEEIKGLQKNQGKTNTEKLRNKQIALDHLKILRNSENSKQETVLKQIHEIEKKIQYGTL